tara:strand:- start:1604 stop:2302 length:699 start_codon:yes stop_codon:yes gene_type:complete
VKFDFVEIGSSCFKTLSEVFRDDDTITGLSIEPVPHLYNAIKEFCKDSKNKHFLKCAVVENKTTDFVDFYHTVDKNMSSISEAGIGSVSRKMIKRGIQKAKFSVNSKIKTISVPAMTFLEVVDKYKINEIGLLKIDAEGLDYDIVKSVLKSDVKVQTILFEAEPFMTKDQKLEIVSLLEEKNFIVTKNSRDFYCQKEDSEWTFKRYKEVSERYIQKNKWLEKIDHSDGNSER